MTDPNPLAPIDTLIGYVDTLLDCPDPETSTEPIVVAARERQAALGAWEASLSPVDRTFRNDLADDLRGTPAAQEQRAA
jgi:hypothetical protein